MFFMNFAQRLQILREQKGLTQDEISTLINVTQPAYCAYECGKRLPSKNTQIMLAKVFKISVDELMNGKEEPMPSDKVIV